MEILARLVLVRLFGKACERWETLPLYLLLGGVTLLFATLLALRELGLWSA